LGEGNYSSRITNCFDLFSMIAQTSNAPKVAHNVYEL
jgi:hypothetical protein